MLLSNTRKTEPARALIQSRVPVRDVPFALSRRAFLGALSVAPVAAAPSEPWRLTITEAAHLIKRKQLSPVELASSCWKRLEALNPRLNAVITPLGEQAMAQARAAENAKGKGPLHGIPIGLKDLFDTAGIRTTSASAQHAQRVPTADAWVVRKLRDAGAIFNAKLNLDEFAYNFTSETSHFGKCLNPWNPALSPGGSSGGSAVATATGMCLGALGSDTGGSIRLPAALCGITGYKPSYGLICTDGATPLAWSLDHIGPMTRTAADARLLLSVLAGRPFFARDYRKIRLGVPRALFYDSLDPAVASAVEAATQTLAKLCRSLADTTLPAWAVSETAPPLPASYATVITAEAYAYHERMAATTPQQYHPGTLRSIENGKGVPSAAYISAHRDMERLRHEVRTVFEKVDVLITPTAPFAKLPFGTSDLQYLRNTAPFNMLGLPTVSIPCGFTADGLPVGVQLTAAHGADDRLLALAMAFQTATDFHTKRPAL